jgi:hypothetical protein
MNYSRLTLKSKIKKSVSWIFNNRIKFLFYSIIIFLFARAAINIFYNLSNLNNIEKGILIKIEESTGEGMSRRLHYTIKKANSEIELTARDDDSEDCDLQINDSVTFIDIGLGYCLLTTCNNFKLEGTFQKIDTISFFLFSIISLGFIFLPKLINRLKNKQNQKITKYLNEKYKNNRNDDSHRIEL